MESRDGFSREHLRFYWAELRHKEAVQQGACEQLLSFGVELRVERRELQDEIGLYQREAVEARETSVRAVARYGKSTGQLRSELDAQKASLGSVRTTHRAVLEDEPEDSLQDVEEQCQLLREEDAEWRDACEASEQLTEHLANKLGSLEAEVGRLRVGRIFDPESRRAAEPSTEELERLRNEVKVLSRKATMVAGEADEETRVLWDATEGELPRLRRADEERRDLQAQLSQARHDRDSLERDYQRVLRGLGEQEASQEINKRGLLTTLMETRAEGEEMVASLRKTDENLAELRLARADAEAFSEHLSTQVARLEMERNRLIQSLLVRQPGSGAAGPLASMGRATEEEALAWRRQDRMRANEEGHEALLRDEEEVRVVEEDCRGLETQLAESERHNAELRGELAALQRARTGL